MPQWTFRNSLQEQIDQDYHDLEFLQHAYSYKCKHGVNTYWHKCAGCNREKEILEKLEKGEL